MEYFSHVRISEHIIRIKDICGTFLYLVEGKDRACLIDTGDGYGDLGSYIRQLTDKPVFVILTHGHMDHASGACFFNDNLE